MESVEDIHKRIAELSSAIDLQLDVLKSLEKRRSVARRTLNSRLDPMARLPVEIASEIFIRCTPDSPSPVFTEEPLKFLHVCQLWRRIAVSCPSLWASIQLKQLGPDLDPDFLKTCWDWLGRARALPLSLSLHEGVHYLLSGWLKHFGRQIAHMELRLSEESQVYGVRTQGPFPLLQTMKIQYLKEDPADSESETSDDTDDPSSFYFISSSIAMLLAAPLLVECTFDSVRYLYANDHLRQGGSRMTHTSLRHLRLGTPSPGSHSSNSAGILLGLNLPALETLHLTDLDISPEDLTSFFAASGSPSSLQALHMSISRFENAEWRLSTQLLNSCFRPLGALRTLELFHGLEIDYIALLSVMRAQDFLPHLQHLPIHGRFGTPQHWKLVLETMLARGVGTERSLRSVKVISTVVPKKTDLPVEVLERMRELVKEEGMSIYVGSISTNFV
ncbi:hypothetical protein R3P38DRAFT_2607028 [Favolaschia claudopus]|uniref:F-box domain-containing protein n=1 Tax=Favolaschia claudopus TaxID=2862362 RepID=A0AAW0DDH7_9AGAR